MRTERAMAGMLFPLLVLASGCSSFTDRPTPKKTRPPTTTTKTAAEERKDPANPEEEPPKSKWRITVQPKKVLGEVNPLVFGHNLEAADTQFIFSGNRSNTVQGRTGDGVWDPQKRVAAAAPASLARDIGVSMMRYPGGCLAHNFDWKKTVGPVASRPAFAFGLDEFLKYCETIRAEPLITVSAYIATPQDARDLVEYLNAPATAAHPWAMKRARYGRAKPYRVTYFEMGNEADHGNHDVVPSRKLTPEQYAAWVLECAAKMRRVDPRIWIGAHMGTGTPPTDPWNHIVLAKTRDVINYVIVHTYSVGLHKREPRDLDRALRAALAAVEQMERTLAAYREVIFQGTGRDIPLAVTEYNAMYVQETPVPMRFSLAAALFSADYVRVLLKPESNVTMANYWHFANGYWGMVRGPRIPGVDDAPWKKMPAYHLYRLWGQHFGTRLVATAVTTPMVEFEGCLRVRAARPGSYERSVELDLRPGSGPGYSWKVTGPNAMTLAITNAQGSAYPEFTRALPKPGRAVTIRFESRAAGSVPQTARLGIGMIDARGWHKVQWGVGVDSIRLSKMWQRHERTIQVLHDSPGVSLTWRLISEHAAVDARVEVRKLELVEEKDDPPYAALTASSSVSKDGKTLYVVAFNKHPTEDITAEVVVRDTSVERGAYWEVTGPSLAATNLGDERVEETKSAIDIDTRGRRVFLHTFPKHSMTAFEFELPKRE